MAEIKSTLELIMERTKNLTMTEEEKEKIFRKKSRQVKSTVWYKNILTVSSASKL